MLFNDINYGYRIAMLKKIYLWLLLFYVAVATYYYYEKVRRTMRTAIVLYLNHCNWTRTHNHLVRKRTLNHLAKLTSEHTVYCTSLIKILKSKGSNINP